jgi:SAM-dependent methyltransferase
MGAAPGARRADSLSCVDVDLAGSKDGISERFVPDQDRGRLIEVEHIARYQWAAQAARGRIVLDAGCGAAYGSRLLADGGASEVIGVDIAASVLESVAPSMPDNVTLRTGDLRRLEFEDDSFDLIACFEVIEHFTDPSTVIDELVRVLAPAGILLVSSPNRGVYQADNPHHLHEFTPAELKAELERRLVNVTLVRQHDYVVSAVLTDDAYATGDGASIEDVTLRKLVGATPGDEAYTIAIASDAAPPQLTQLATLTGTLELTEWLSVFDDQTDAINAKDNYIKELEARLAEHDRLGVMLTQAEQQLAQMPDLNIRIGALQDELSEVRAGAEVARRQAQELDQLLMYGRRVLRHVRPLIGPLRKARRMLRS